MSHRIRPYYDVVIMGGGPAGSTLAALLARDSDLSVAVLEREEFPREHIGESFNHPVVSSLEHSGALGRGARQRLLGQETRSHLRVGSRASPHRALRALQLVRDGVYRWSMHVNRSEFDKILLDHARDTGAHVFEGVDISAFRPLEEGCAATLEDGRDLRARVFVDASGRQSSIAAKTRRSWLSAYKNIAIWQHYLGCRNADQLDGPWPNLRIFRDNGFSPIGSFAFKDGWCWFIPVPKIVDGERRRTHSVGIVTNPAVLKKPGTDFTDPETVLRTVKQVPLLGDLVQDATPIRDRMLTATNYSMINESFANFDERWLLVGDAAYFVDPLFSSGVGFAMAHAHPPRSWSERPLMTE